MHKSLHCPQVAVFSIISAVSSTVAIMEEFVFFPCGVGCTSVQEAMFCVLCCKHFCRMLEPK